MYPILRPRPAPPSWLYRYGSVNVTAHATTQNAAVPTPMIFERFGPTHISVAHDHASGPHDMLNANT
jgi:hypothetical protein